MSVKRLKTLLDAPTFPEEVRMLQKLFMSADLAIPGPTAIDPSAKQPTGEAAHFEVFKVSWQSRASQPKTGKKTGDSRPSSRGSNSSDYHPSVKIERMVNFINR